MSEDDGESLLRNLRDTTRATSQAERKKKKLATERREEETYELAGDRAR